MESSERPDDLLRLCRAAFDRNTEAFERNREAFDRNTEAFERNREAFEGLRDFTREMMLRFERVDARSEASHQRMIERIDRLTEVVIDHRDEGRAQTRALLRVLDRLEGGGAAPATS